MKVKISFPELISKAIHKPEQLVIKNNLRAFPDGRMNTEQAALYVGLSLKTMAMMRCNGTSPPYIKRGRIFYYKEDLDAWINRDGKATSTAQQRFNRKNS